MKFKFNIPNKITIIRISLIPLFILILLSDNPYKNLLAAFIFIMLSASDFLDGYFARKKNQVTEFGKLLDPIADKLLISTALVLLVGKGVDLWMAATIIAREFIITAVRIYLLPSKIVVAASNFGKTKTFVQSTAIIFVLLDLPLRWYVMLAAVLLTIVSGAEYLVKIRGLTGNKVVNLPNMITLARFLLIIPFVYYLLDLRLQIALFIFAVIALSDKLDGISARLMNQKTELGSGLDSFTDWTLITSAFILLVIKDYIDVLWFVLLVIPMAISCVLKVLYAKRQKVVPVTFVARLSVGLTYATLISILINFEYRIYLLAATVAMAYVTMTGYLIKALTVQNKYDGNNKRESIF